MLQSAYAESYKLSDSESDFEVTLLKRKITDNLDYCRNFANNFFNEKKAEKKFDEFLRRLTAIRDDIRLAYLVTSAGGLRDEEYLLRAEQSRKKTQAALEQNLSAFEKIESRVKALGEATKTLEESAAESDRTLEGINEAAASAETLKAKMAASFEVVSKYEQQVTDAHSTVNESSAEIATLLAKSQKSAEILASCQEDLDRIQQETNEQLECNRKQQSEIEQTLAAANRVGMAGSFHSRKTELRASLLTWGACFVVTVLAIFGVSFYFLYPYITTGVGALGTPEFLFKLAVVAPLVWLAWMSARQFGYVSKIREDYAFKYATAMAFEGYRKHAHDIDEDLLRSLLNQSLETMALNPIRLYSEKQDHASPLHELGEKVMKKVPDVNLGRKSTAEPSE
ncbi:hypothetical protein SAMN03097708_01848 [Thiohalomonas denitrificans]|uniref:Uncharacterized protein n=2 Tax=Thiohalomonas denitrificans TaxID=415747 RepID=A0A1G5QBX5_9GAMM|nr:hypothetical protein SAMN03097708_01848 [Thiohalomonas denitrificans]